MSVVIFVDEFAKLRDEEHMENTQRLEQELKGYKRKKDDLEHSPQILELFKTALAIVLDVSMGGGTKFNLETEKSYTGFNLQIFYRETHVGGRYPYAIEIRNNCELVFSAKINSLESITKAKGNWRDFFPLPNGYLLLVDNFHEGDWTKQLKQTKHRDLKIILKEIKKEKYIRELNKKLENYRYMFD